MLRSDEKSTPRSDGKQRKTRRGIRPTGRRIAAMEFLVDGVPRGIEITALVIAGWTGRDKAAVEHHIAELAAIGVKRPRAIPCFYRLGADLLTMAPRVGGGRGESRR